MRLPRTLTLTIAVIAALGSAAAVRKAIVARPQQQPTVVARTSKVELLVASRAFTAGERIAAADLRWRNWPRDAVPDGAIIRNSGVSLDDFEKTYARYPVMAGEPVAETKLVRPGAGSHAAALIAAGKRAVAVPVREESAAGGLVQPNDRVDVLWSSNSPGNAYGQKRAQTLLRNIKVLAIGGSVNTDTAQSGNNTATLELTQEQARTVAGARIGGEISLALIPFAEDITAALPATAYADIGASPVKMLKFGRGSAGPMGRNPQ